MFHFLALTLVSAVILALLYLAYKWMLAEENHPVFNRALLLSFYLAAPAIAVALLHRPSSVAAVGVEGMTLTGTGQSGAAAADSSSWPAVILIVWLAGIAVAVVRLLLDYGSLLRIDNRGSSIKVADRTIMVIDDDITPFSFGGRIYMSRRDAQSEPYMIIAHEEAHVRLRHSLDIVLASLFAALQWFNPVAWLLIDELKSVHEYQADRAVLSMGIDACAYQLLLIKKAVGGSFPAIANSLNHSKLKKRITMMQKSKSGRWHAVRALALLPAIATAALVVNIPAVASTLTELSAASVTTADKISKKTAETNNDTVRVSAAVEKVARFEGGEVAMMEWLVENIHYPANVRFEGKKRCVVKFTVSESGKITSPEIIRSTEITALDEEAMRVVNSMPDFEPATVGGKPVASTYVLPFVFALK